MYIFSLIAISFQIPVPSVCVCVCVTVALYIKRVLKDMREGPPLITQLIKSDWLIVIRVQSDCLCLKTDGGKTQR